MHNWEPPLTQGIHMRSHAVGKWRLPLQGLTKHSGTILYWGFFLRIGCFHLVSELCESQICLGSSGDFSGPLVLSPLEEFQT
jgi:hypothetical protein